MRMKCITSRRRMALQPHRRPKKSHGSYKQRSIDLCKDAAPRHTINFDTISHQN